MRRHHHPSVKALLRACLTLLLSLSLVVAPGSHAFVPTTTAFVISRPSKKNDDSAVILAARGRRHQKSSESSKQKQPRRSQSSSSSLSQPRRPKTQLLPLSIAPDCTVHVSQIVADDPWWQQSSSLSDDKQRPPHLNNPYGARVWPASLGLAQRLWNNEHYYNEDNHSNILASTHVLEVGCGTGLVAQTAALAGATVHATDISPVALELSRQGWAATRKEHANKNSATVTTTTTTTTTTTPNHHLTMSTYDIRNALPTTNKEFVMSNQQQHQLFVASCVLYEGDLGVAMAERVLEAYQQGMWILLGDDDTGYRQGGRQAFMHRLAVGGMSTTTTAVSWQTGMVKCPQLGWREKPFAYLEFNAPLQQS